MASVLLHQNKTTFLTVTQTCQTLGESVGAAKEVEVRLATKFGLYPFGYLTGFEKGQKVFRPIYEQGAVVDTAAKPRPKNDKERISELENKVNELLTKLGENT